jgi:probable biosynthetic protein (TIGR04098 family)
MAQATTFSLPMVRVIEDSSVSRTAVVAPGMCGGSLFVGQIGDWTWEAVSLLCDINAFAATTNRNTPSYLSFCYIHIRGSIFMNIDRLKFGDRIQMNTRLFNFSSESTFALHKIKPMGAPAEVIEPHDFYAYKDPHCIYVETFNRWITRSRPGSNEDLVRSSPVGFEYRHLPSLPDCYSPRREHAHARKNLSFLNGIPESRTSVPQSFCIEYSIDVTRDINGVGLLYFASYFSIVDQAVLRFWRHMGRTDLSFINRIVLDSKMGYFGNAEVDSTLLLHVEAWGKDNVSGDEIINVLITNRNSGKNIAVCTMHVIFADAS